MLFTKEIEFCLERIREIEKSFFESKDVELLPLSFFSDNFHKLSQLKNELYNMEEAQLRVMDKHFREKKDIIIENSKPEDTFTPEEKKEQKEEIKEVSMALGFLNDKVGKKIYNNLRTSLSLNDRFRFQKVLFDGDIDRMNETLDYLDKMSSVQEVFSYLQTHFEWDWNNDSTQAFKEMLEKRFS
jgi:hypothetical protein